MSSTPFLPGIDTCGALYLDVWEQFGERGFTSNDVSHGVAQQRKATDNSANTNEVEGHLDLLVAYGLLEREDDDQYRVRCTPTESVEQWQRKRRPQLEAVHHRIQQQTRRREDGSSEKTGDAEFVQRMGETYVSVRFDENATLSAVIDDLGDSLHRSPNTAGIALRSPAVLSGRVQQLADELCSAEAMAGTDLPRFEKVNSDVVGEDKNDLEYRLYLHAVR